MRPHNSAPFSGPHQAPMPAAYQSHHQPLHPQQYSGPGYRSGPPAGPGPVDPYYSDRGPMHDDHYGHGGLGDVPMHEGHGDIPHHGGPPMHHHPGGGRGGPPGGPRGEVGGTWMVNNAI